MFSFILFMYKSLLNCHNWLVIIILTTRAMLREGKGYQIGRAEKCLKA